MLQHRSVSEAIRNEHVEVGHHMGELREVLAAEPLDWERLGLVFEFFRERLRRHFALEELDYLPGLPAGDPHLSREREDLRAEHELIRSELDRIRIGLAHRTRRGLKRRVENLLSHLASHEDRENLLLRSAALQAPGAEA